MQINKNNQKNHDKPAFVQEAENLIGETVELTQEDLSYYRENIIKNSKPLDKTYFDTN